MSSITLAQATDERVDDPEVVELEVPASAAYIAVVRTAAAGLAARVDLTLDRIEDLRIAVDEACALLLPQPFDGPLIQSLRCTFTLNEASLTVDVSGPHTQLPQESAFAWAVLSALVDGLECGDEDGRTWLSLVVRRGEGVWS